MSIHPSTQERPRLDGLLYPDSGLLDIFVGLGILFAGLFLAAQMPWLVAILPTSLGPAWYAARRALIAPRITVSQGETVSPSRVNWLLALLVALGVLSLLLAIAATLAWDRDALPGWLYARPVLLPTVGFGLPIVLALALASLVLRIARYRAYAVLAVVVFVGGYLIGWAGWQSVAVTGTVVTAGGLVSLKFFLDAHPRASPRR